MAFGPSCGLGPTPMRFLGEFIEDKNPSGLHYMSLALMVILRLRAHCLKPEPLQVPEPSTARLR